MSSPGSSTSSWLEARSRRPAPEILAGVMRDLVRARRLQALLEHLWGGLFWAMLAACAAVLAIRLGNLPYSMAAVVAGLLIAGLAVAALVGYWRRPGELGVAILADLKLNLKQQLSTAWEFARSRAGSGVAQRLAAQAVRARLPSRPELVFPLRFNLWGRMIPAAALLLVLVIVVELPSRESSQPGVADTVLRSEGIRLREYGQRMEIRAKRDELSRSERESRQMQRLGSRMETGSLSREQALSRLRQLADALDSERRAALEQDTGNRIGPLNVQTLEQAPRSSSALGGLSARAMLDKLLDGELQPGDLSALESNPGGLSRLGISAEDVEQALRGFSQGEQEKLKELLEQLARTDQALEDAGQLGDARQQVQQAAENLGDPLAAQRPGAGEPAPALGEGEDDLGDFAAAQMMELGDGDTQYSAGQAGSGETPDGALRPDPRASLPESGQAQAVLKPEARYGEEGEVFKSEARVLPRAAKPAVEQRELDPRFQSQLEEVLSKESVPMHQKAFLRRYFLNLSEGSEETGQ